MDSEIFSFARIRFARIVVEVLLVAGAVSACGFFPGFSSGCEEKADRAMKILRESTLSYLDKSSIDSIESVDECDDDGSLPHLIIAFRSGVDQKSAMRGFEKSPWREPTPGELPGYESVLYVQDLTSGEKIILSKERAIPGEPSGIVAEFQE